MLKGEMGDKIKIKALLDTYSANDISLIFSEIDTKMFSLHNCSSDDFLRLNTDFKDLYNKSKLISKNVTEVFNVLNTKNNKQIYNEISLFYNNLINNANILNSQIEKVINFLKDLTNKLRFVFFPIKNYEQNLTSLKYLVANLNLAILYSVDNNGIIQSFNKIEKNVNDLKSILEQIPRISNDTIKIAKKSLVNFSENTDQKELSIEILLNTINNRIELIEKKYNKNEKGILEIQKMSDNSANSISDIIKKLQYQDIIKQKMEHIQLTHKELIQELYEFEDTPDNEIHLNEKAKFFLRVRDVAGLQAAQLIQANKEYQSALEIIINNFIQIGDNMKAVSQTSGDIVVENKEDITQLFEDLTEQVTRTEQCYLKKIANNTKLYNDLASIDLELVQAENLLSSIVELNGELNTNLNQYYLEIDKLTDNDPNNIRSLNQIKNLYTDIEQNSYKLAQFTEQISSVRMHISKLDDEKRIDILKVDFKEIKKNLNNVYKTIQDLDRRLEENHKISNNALESIKKSISEIKYYDYFESIIEEVIIELKTVNINLKVDGEELSTKVENLKKLKNHYTMETEHAIHDSVALGNDIKVENDESGDIEFF